MGFENNESIIKKVPAENSTFKIQTATVADLGETIQVPGAEKAMRFKPGGFTVAGNNDLITTVKEYLYEHDKTMYAEDANKTIKALETLNKDGEMSIMWKGNQLVVVTTENPNHYKIKFGEMSQHFLFFATDVGFTFVQREIDELEVQDPVITFGEETNSNGEKQAIVSVENAVAVNTYTKARVQQIKGVKLVRLNQDSQIGRIEDANDIRVSDRSQVGDIKKANKVLVAKFAQVKGTVEAAFIEYHPSINKCVPLTIEGKGAEINVWAGFAQGLILSGSVEQIQAFDDNANHVPLSTYHPILILDKDVDTGWTKDEDIKELFKLKESTRVEMLRSVEDSEFKRLTGDILIPSSAGEYKAIKIKGKDGKIRNMLVVRVKNGNDEEAIAFIEQIKVTGEDGQERKEVRLRGACRIDEGGYAVNADEVYYIGEALKLGDDVKFRVEKETKTLPVSPISPAVTPNPNSDKKTSPTKKIAESTVVRTSVAEPNASALELDFDEPAPVEPAKEVFKPLPKNKLRRKWTEMWRKRRLKDFFEKENIVMGQSIREYLFNCLMQDNIEQEIQLLYRNGQLVIVGDEMLSLYHSRKQIEESLDNSNLGLTLVTNKENKSLMPVIKSFLTSVIKFEEVKDESGETQTLVSVSNAKNIASYGKARFKDLHHIQHTELHHFSQAREAEVEDSVSLADLSQIEYIAKAQWIVYSKDRKQYAPVTIGQVDYIKATKYAQGLVLGGVKNKILASDEASLSTYKPILIFDKGISTGIITSGEDFKELFMLEDDTKSEVLRSVKEFESIKEGAISIPSSAGEYKAIKIKGKDGKIRNMLVVRVKNGNDEEAIAFIEQIKVTGEDGQERKEVRLRGAYRVGDEQAAIVIKTLIGLNI